MLFLIMSQIFSEELTTLTWARTERIITTLRENKYNMRARGHERNQDSSDLRNNLPKQVTADSKFSRRRRN